MNYQLVEGNFNTVVVEQNLQFPVQASASNEEILLSHIHIQTQNHTGFTQLLDAHIDRFGKEHVPVALVDILKSRNQDGLHFLDSCIIGDTNITDRDRSVAGSVLHIADTIIAVILSRSRSVTVS